VRPTLAIACVLAAAAVLALVAGCGTEPPAASAPPGDTRAATLVDRDGDGFLERGPGEPLRERADLGRAGRPGRTLATFGQLTDTHVRDEESPARAPFLDRLGPPFTSTFRPQEALSPQVLAAAVRALNRERPQAVAITGDIIDSAQSDELDQALAVLDGGRVDPDTGRPGYEGVQAASDADPLYYRPDNDAPRHPGLLQAAERPFSSPGLRAPWYPAIGNHDILVQGEVPPTPRLERVATGNRMVVGLDPDIDPPRAEASAATAVEAILAGGLPGRRERVTADPDRRHLSPAELIARLHRRPRDGRLEYAFDIGSRVRGIVLDTVRRDGGSRGLVTPGQLAWLRAQLAAAGSRYVVVFAHNPLESSDGGQAALAALDAHPRVVAVVAGNRHRNTIEPHRSPGGGGFWLVGTSSLADFPMQGRMLRLREAAGGGAVLETWMVDQDGRGVAGVARELAYLDAQGGRPQGFAGRPADRNARLDVPAR
jgi:3',5'-cyclic AMP phosphodiesterase CpdA